MAVTALTVRSGPFVGNGVAVAFPFTFNASDVDEVGVVAPEPLGFYQVDLLADRTGTVTFDEAPAAGVVFWIVSDPDFRQLIGFDNQGRALPRTLDEAEDRAAVQRLYLLDRTSRAIKLPAEAVLPEDIELPKAAVRANKFLAFDANGRPIVTDPPRPRNGCTPCGDGGSAGPPGPQGPAGPMGPPGDYTALDLIGVSADIDDRPLTADEGDGWGLIEGENITVFIWTNGDWFQAGPVNPVSPQDVPVANTIFVKVDGNPARNGRSEADAVQTVEQALAIRAGMPGTVLIKVGAGTYFTAGHIDMPDNTVIQGVHRATTFKPLPDAMQKNMFRMGSGCFIEGLMIEGLMVDSLDNPTEGFAFSFRPGAVITRVPYVHKCAVRANQPAGFIGGALDPLNGNPDFPCGPGVALADGLVCSQYSIFPNIMTWGATPVAYNGIGYCAKNGGLINAVNAISMWCHKHFLALSGGQIILSSCATQFGDYSMQADGMREIIVPREMTVPLVFNEEAGTTINDNRAAIIDDLWDALVAGSYTAGWDANDEAYTRTDADTWLRAVASMVCAGDDAPIQRFQTLMFTVMADPVFSPDKLNAFIFSFEFMRDQIAALLPGQAVTNAMVSDATEQLIETLETPNKRVEPSRIEAIGHTWTANMIGVWAIKIPPAEARLPIRDSILETNGGTVIATGQDSSGNAIFAGDVFIDARFGMGGRGFIAPVRREAIRAAITFGAF